MTMPANACTGIETLAGEAAWVVISPDLVLTAFDAAQFDFQILLMSLDNNVTGMTSICEPHETKCPSTVSMVPGLILLQMRKASR